MPRWALILLLVAAAIAVLAASAFTLFFVDWGTCSGDGGSPYSAEDSVAGEFCDGPLRGPWALALLLGPVALLLALGITGIVRARGMFVAIGAAAGVAAIVAFAAPVLALPGNCSDEDQRAYDRWLYGDRSGTPPADCDTY